MFQTTARAAGLLFSLAALFAPLAANGDTLGSITATIDGTDATWFITGSAGESQSSAARIPGIPGVDISLWGNPDAAKLAQLKGALLLDFMALTTGAPQAMDPTLQYLEQGYAGAYVAVDEGATRITLTSLDISDSQVSLAGRFEALAAFTDDIASLQTDPARSQAISGHFEAVLPLP